MGLPNPSDDISFPPALTEATVLLQARGEDSGSQGASVLPGE